MKKLFAFVLVLILLMSCAFATEWELAESSDEMDEATALFEEAMEGFVGVGYEPKQILYRLADGEGYCILCKATVIVPDAPVYYAAVTVTRSEDGSANLEQIQSIDPMYEEMPFEREYAEEFEFEASPDEEIYISDLLFTEDVTVTGVGENVHFVNCGFEGNVINAAPEKTYVWIDGGCEFYDGAHCVVASGVREAGMEYQIPKIATFVPVEVECGDLGGVLAVDTEEITFDGNTYTAADVMYKVDENDNLVPVEDGDEYSVLIAMHWWENGEEILLVLGYV